MRAPTAEQLTILTEDRPGFLLVRGAAGSGKTTTALLRLRQLSGSRLARRERLGLPEPVRILVLTYNRTLEGYIRQLAEDSVDPRPGLQLEVSTFSKWAARMLGNPAILEGKAQREFLLPLLSEFRMSTDFLLEEIDYLLGRFRPDRLYDYVGARRDGRGISPRMETPTRIRLIEEVVGPYQAAKSRAGFLDWNDIAYQSSLIASAGIDVVIIDEAQDFSANQVRSVVHHLAADFNATFVIDSVQRIYARYYAWNEAGVTDYRSRRLARNYRNTREIAAFAAPLVQGLPIGDDGSIPDFSACVQSGARPVVVRGTYSSQVKYAIEALRDIDLDRESVAFLKPKGGGWFNTLKEALRVEGLDFCVLTRQSHWPQGREAIALSTLYSAKGLEFDHVFILGLNQEVTPHGAEEGDTQLEALRRLVAMGIGRARISVHVGYKGSEASSLVRYFDPSTYREVRLDR